MSERKKFRITIFMKDQTFYISAKNQQEAIRKAYDRVEKKSARSLIDKGLTEIF